MDLFCEQLVKRKKTVKDTLIIAAMFITLVVIPVLGFVLSMLVNPYFMMVAIFVFALDIYFVWYVVTGRNIEYEYIVTNNNLTIDRVMAKRRRKRVISLDIKNIDEMCTLGTKELSKGKCERVIFAGATDFGEKEYQMKIYTEKFGNTLVVFSPNEKTLKAMKPFLKAQVALNIFRG